jgi:pyruvate,water dikinase
LDNSQTPEVASLRALQQLAADVRRLFPGGHSLPRDRDALWTYLQENPQGQEILAKFQAWLSLYGYLSEVGTDIAVPRWQENPQPVRDLLWQFALRDEPASFQNSTPVKSRKSRGVQKRLNLKGRATAVYSQLLAHLRWSFLALEEIWLASGLLSQAGDIFFLEYEEICLLISEPKTPLKQQLPQLLSQRRQEFQGNQQRSNIPDIAYGNPETFAELPPPALKTEGQLQGIAASPGQAVGKVKILRNLQGIGEIDRETILVVPYTDSGWAPLLAHAGGLIAEVGGSLSHGAIVAREYGIPAVMDVHNATQLLTQGQRVRIDGQRGIVEIL